MSQATRIDFDHTRRHVRRAHRQSLEQECEICHEPCVVQLDHDHYTGLTRGGLCGNCNRGLGALRDDPELVRRALEYLEHYESI